MASCWPLAGLPARLPEPALVSGHAGHAAQQDLASVRNGELNFVPFVDV
jgi:hypothetical protein